MKCPYCGEEMQHGYLKSVKPFSWSPEKEIHLFNIPRKGEFDVSNNGWDSCYTEADFCPKCEKIILDVAKGT